MRRRRRGFTLIELLVVVALISIMMVIAVPSFASFISGYRATSAVNEVLQGIMMTRGEALKRGRRVTMLPNAGDAARTPSAAGSWANGWTIFVDMNSNQAFDSATDTMIFRHGDLATSTTVAAPGPAFTLPFGGANFVAFDGAGYPRLVNGTQLNGGIRLTDRMGASTNVRTLCIANFGRPRIVKGIDDCSAG